MTITNAMPLLEFVGVSRSYETGRSANGRDRVRVVALDTLNLSISRGEFMGVVGPSGGGKSTFLNLAGALDRPSSGQIFYDGNRLAAFSGVSFRRNHVGFIFQNYHLLQNRTALDNVALGLMLTGVSRRRSQIDAEHWLSRLGLKDRVRHFPSMLSGGECQRVAIARAMVKQPSLLLADEPTGNLDHASRLEVLTAISGLHREFGTTVIMVTHTPAEARAYCTRLITIDQRLQSEESTPAGI